ncbi:MAG TPA: DUF4402 domain-containing protein [Clostridia bacterium]|nr:DUF4402 domain-containing protein [Clostridia bacterium]
MKKINIIILILIVTFIMSFGIVQADNSTDTETVNIYATVMGSISISSVTDMNFGAGTAPQPGAGAGEVTLTTGGNASIGYTGYWDSADASAAELDVSGLADYTYTVKVNGDTFAHNAEQTLTSSIVLDTSGAGNLEVTMMTVLESTSGVFDNDGGDDTLFIGAVLSIPEDYPAGNYTADFPVEVTYE